MTPTTFKQRMAEASKLLRKAIEQGKLLNGSKTALRTAKRNQIRWSKAARQEYVHAKAIALEE
jgi:hypothetical protein